MITLVCSVFESLVHRLNAGGKLAKGALDLLELCPICRLLMSSTYSYRHRNRCMEYGVQIELRRFIRDGREKVEVLPSPKLQPMSTLLPLPAKPQSRH